MVDISFTIILQWLNFAILIFLLTKILYRPLIQFLDRREKEIVNTYDQAKTAKEEADKILDDYRKKLDGADQEARRIVFESRREGMEEREEIISRAKRESEKIIEKAGDEIRLQEKKVRKKLRDEAVNLSISIAGKFLEKEIDETDQKRFAGKYIKELEEMHG